MWASRSSKRSGSNGLRVDDRRAGHVGKVCTRSLILGHVWGPSYANETHYLKVYAYRIRKKLHDEQGRFLQTDPSAGYRLKATGT
ncbi:winged helix-turn-helix domain-containing protein [Planotetraspora silvatica]|uniref:winged helix-turn-helix domain-containing protein n=1 Tax=Planotetraspora silvatica TaxID=234614 RepID=UPI0023B209AB|nr:helix-turn-helix domain-containing protein [Planotetraspora silvatica]